MIFTASPRSPKMFQSIRHLAKRNEMMRSSGGHTSMMKLKINDETNDSDHTNTKTVWNPHTDCTLTFCNQL